MMKNEKRRVLIRSLQIFLPLLIGGVLYLWIKPNAWCSVHLAQLLSLGERREFDETVVPVFGYLIKHQLCDMLFAYSMTFALLSVFAKGTKKAVLSCGIAALFETLLELSQLFGFPGHFDPFDILAEVSVSTGILLCLLIKERKTKK